MQLKLEAYRPNINFIIITHDYYNINLLFPYFRVLSKYKYEVPKPSTYRKT